MIFSEHLRRIVTWINVVSLVATLIPTPALAKTVESLQKDEPVTQTQESISDVSAVFVDDVGAADINADVVTSSSVITDALVDAGMPKKRAKNAGAMLLGINGTKSGGTIASEGIPRSADGSNVEALSLWWITQDTEDDGNSDTLYIKPLADEEQQVRMRLNYALSGEFDYNAGDVRITIPDKMFYYRDGSVAGKLVIPYPEAPDASQDFMWEHVGDTYVLTSTRRMSAATKGFIEFAFTGLVPHKLVDMAWSDDFKASIEVTTHYNNLIGLTSNDLKARFDTEQVVDAAYKRVVMNGVKWVSASEIPEAQRIAGETEYVVVTWDVYAHHYGNTEYTLDVIDQSADEYHGFVIGASADDEYGSRLYENVETGWAIPGTFGHMTVRTAYAGSQFAPNTDYLLKNKVTYILTEADPTIDDDEQKVTQQIAIAETPFRWHEPVFEEPVGHFMLNKIGNDGANGRDSAPYWSRSYNYNVNGWYKSIDIAHYKDNFHNTDDGYGIYPSALNDLREGQSVEVAYTVESQGWMAPWQADRTMDLRLAEAYGRRPVYMVTYDTDWSQAAPLYLDGGEELVWGEDWTYKAVEFPMRPYIGRLVAVNLNEEGGFVAQHQGDGTFEYASERDDSYQPYICLEGYKNGDWIRLAVAHWNGSAYEFVCENGAMADRNRVLLPDGIERTRTVVSSLNAYLFYYVRPIIDIKPSEHVVSVVESLFAESGNPTIGLHNTASMDTFEEDGTPIVDFHKNAMDELRGYSTEIAVHPVKNAKQSIADIDFSKREVYIHYTAEVEERSLISDMLSYKTAVEDGRIIPETRGVWRDLLPVGVYPIVDTVKLREQDKILDAYTIENWRNSGRTLLVVECELTPKLTQYEYGSRYDKRIMDVPTITFDAIYSFEDLRDYGDEVHNVISFESLAKDEIGNYPDWSGESDDTYGTGNIATQTAFEDDIERELLKGVDDDRTTPSFVYAGTTTKIDALAAARTSLSKDIMVNNDGRWSQGTYTDKRTVYEGGQYSYRLRTMSDNDTETKDIVVYDALESFYAGDGNDEVDIDAPRWRGYFRSIDLTQLEAIGIAPVVYYSTIPNLQLSDETNTLQANATNTNLENNNVWIKASDYHGSLDDIRAIAVDCSKDTNGEDFILDEFESVSFVVRMQAPSGEDARTYISQKGIWGDSAHAYNNAYLLCTSIDKNTGIADSDNFVRKDYTKVGLMEHTYTVKKSWLDDRDCDGIRPDSVTLHLLADGVDTGLAQVARADNDWEVKFEHVPYTDPDGNKIRYSVSEDRIDGYEFTSMRSGLTITALNTHEPETISIDGVKTWIDADGHIPDKIYVTALMDGTEYETHTVTDDGSGTWKYSFENLPKYRDHGTLIEWTVAESGLDNAFVCEVDGYDIKNTYHPYGDLAIQKTVHNATDEFANRQFGLSVHLMDEEGRPLTGEYAWTSTSGASGVISSGGTLSIRGDEIITIHEIEQGSSYEIIEADTDGYELVGAGLVGTVTANQTVTAELDNYYHAEGTAQVRITKALEGRAMKQYQFRFELVDEDGNVVRTGANQANGNVVFGALSYTEADAGKTYEYTIREVDRGIGGYEYDDSTYRVTVTVTDKGNGHIDTDTHIYDSTGAEIAVPHFENTYHAEGSVKLRAWKRLYGDTLQDKQFEFELLKLDGTSLGTFKNTASGDVWSNAIEYTEQDSGQTYTYVMREVHGTDSTVIYDDHVFGYQVTVTDNGEGEMLTSVEYVPVEPDGTGWKIDRTNIETVSVPVFVNELLPGELTIEKTTTGEVPEEHANDEFTFKVQLVGENMPEGIDYDLEPIESVSPGGFVLGDWWNSLFGIREAYAVESDELPNLNEAHLYSANGGRFDDNESTYTRYVSYPSTTLVGVGVSHTMNVDDGGNKVSNYGDYWSNAHIRGTNRDNAASDAHVITIDGAESLIVEMEYGGESTAYDWVRVWSGNHATYTANSGSSDTDLLAAQLGGVHGTRRFMVTGDSVTFAFRSDSSSCGDGYGYFAKVYGITGMTDNSVIDPVKIPVREGYVFMGWNTSANGSGNWILDDTLENHTLYAQWATENVSYDANGGHFDDDETITQNNIVYDLVENGGTKISHTDNVDDSGTQIRGYNTGEAVPILGTGRDMPSTKAHVVSFDGADKLLVDLAYNTSGIGGYSGYLCIWDGSKPDYTAVRDYGSSLVNKLYGSGGNDVLHKRVIVDSDTVTFAFYGGYYSSLSTPAFYGYYATVTPLFEVLSGEYKEPVRDGYGFVGWNTKPDGSGSSSSFDDNVLYAQWENTVTTYDANGGTFTGDVTENVVTYDKISRAQVSHTNNIDNKGAVTSVFTGSSNDYIRGTGRTSSSSSAHQLQVRDAEKTRLTITYGTGANKNGAFANINGTSTKFTSKSRTQTSVDLDTNTVLMSWSASDMSNIGDGYGYYAVLDYPREIVQGEYLEPTREGYRFVGWDTAADGSDGKSYISGGTLYAQWEEVQSSLVFDANGGSFSDGSSQFVSGNGNPFVYVVRNSDNRNDAGIMEYPYRNDFDNGHTYAKTNVSVPVTDVLNVAVSYGLQGYDAVYIIPGIYDGDFTRSGGSYSYPDNVSGQAAKLTSYGTTEYSTSVQVNDNDVTLALYGYGSGSASGMTTGWHAVITAPNQAMFEVPTKEHYRFVGWNTQPDGTGSEWCDGTGTMYAQWEQVGGTCGGVSWAIEDSNQLVFWPTNGVSGTFERPGDGKWPWLNYLSNANGIESVYVEPGVIACEDMSKFLSFSSAGSPGTKGYAVNNSTIVNIDVSNMDVHNVSNMSNMFSGLDGLTTLNIDGWDTSHVTDFSYWLYRDNTSYTSDHAVMVNWAELDTDSAETMKYMFANRSYKFYEMDLSDLDVSGVDDLSYMFYRTRFNPESIANWDTSGVKNMSHMFETAAAYNTLGSRVYDMNFGNWNVSDVTDMSYMFNKFSPSTRPVILHVDNWDTSNVTTMYSMFEGSDMGSLNPVKCDLSQLEVNNVKNFGYLFYYNNGFKVIDISNWDMSNATYTAYMIGTAPSDSTNYYSNLNGQGTSKIIFGENCNLLSTNSVTASAQSADGKWRRIDETDTDRITGQELSALSNAETGNRERFVGTWVAANLLSVAVLDDDGNLVFVTPDIPVVSDDPEHTRTVVRSIGGTEYTGVVDVDYTGNRRSYTVALFGGQEDLIKTVRVDDDSIMYLPYDTGAYELFALFVNMESFDGARMDMSNQTTFYDLFRHCISLNDIDVSTWDTSNVTSMYRTFGDCERLSEIDLSSWSVDQVTTMSQMFSSCDSLQQVNIDGWNTANVQNMSNMFYSDTMFDAACMESLNVSNVTDFHGMFYGCSGTTALDLSDWNMSSATNIEAMFTYMANLETLNVSGWDTSNVTKSGYSSNDSVSETTSSDYVGYVNHHGLFYGCSSLKELDLSTWNVGGFNSFNGMFSYCSALERLDISSFANLDNTKYRTNMFSNISNLRYVTLGEGFDFTRSDVATDSKYNAILPTPPSATTTGKWVNLEKDATNSLTAAELRNTYDGSDASMVGTWEWEIAQKVFQFDANSGVGVMNDFSVMKNTTQNLPANVFTLFDHDFVGWNTEPDGTGESYEDMAAITYSDNAAQLVKLYAQWQQRDHSIGLENGSFTVTIPAGYRIRVRDLPAGMSYIVTEISSSQPGWSLDSSDGTTGAIRSTETSAASFVNAYTPDQVKVSLGARKILDESVPADGAFTFRLMQNGEQIDEKTCATAGSVVFDELTFRETGTYVYHIVEVEGSDTTITYDNRDYIATVVVTEDNNGVLIADVTYGVSIPETIVDGDNTYTVGTTAVWKGSISSLRLSGLSGEPLKMANFSAAHNGSRTSGGFEQINGLYVVTLGVGPFASNGASETHVGDVVTITFDDGTSIKALVGDMQARNIENPYDPANFDVITETSMNTSNSLHTNGWGTVSGSNISVLGFWGFNAFTNPMAALRSDTGGNQQRVVSIANHGMSREFAGFEPVSGTTGVVSMTTLAGSAAKTQVPVFANRHIPGTLTITKHITGERDETANDQFTVDVVLTSASGGPVHEVQIDGEDEPRTSANGSYQVVLGKEQSVTFVDLPSGTHYMVNETSIPVGWSISKVSDLSGETAWNEADVVSITNEYHATGDVTLQAYKRLSGRIVTSGEFTFELLDSNGDVIDQAQNGAPDMRDTIMSDDGETEIVNPHKGDATVAFSSLHYDVPGVYTYTIREVAGDDASVIYGDTIVGVTVTVTDAGNGQLACAVEYGASGDTIENEIRTGSVTISKHVLSATEAASDTSFAMTVKLVDANGTNIADGVYDTVMTAADGTTSTGTIMVTGGVASFSLVGGESLQIRGLPHGTKYQVSEAAQDCWILTDEIATTGTITGDMDVAVSLTNTYVTSGSFDVIAQKQVENLELRDGDYKFQLIDSDGRVMDIGTNVGNVVTFTGIDIKPEWIGTTRHYQIVEQPGTDASILYDDHAEEIDVAISDDGHGHLSGTVSYDTDGAVFVNKYNPGWLRVSKLSTIQGVEERDGYSLEGAIFEVLDSTGTVVATLVSGEDGMTEEIELTPGSYSVREVGAPEDFIVATGYVRGHVVGGEHLTITVTDEPICGAISVTKKSAQPDITTDSETYNLDGAVYAVFETRDAAQAALEAALAGTYVEADYKPVKTITCVLSDDKLSSSGVAEDLLLGTYYVVEVVPATGYRIAEEVYEVNVIGAEVYAIGEDGFVYDEPNCGFLNLEKFLDI